MSRRSSALALVASTAVSALVLTGCAGAELSSSGERLDGGTIVYAHQQEPACVFGGWIEQAYLSYQVLDNLVSLDEDHQVVPWLAESWEEAEDRSELDLHAEARRRVHRRHPGRRRGDRLQLRLLGRRRQQHRVRLAARLLRVGDRGRRADRADRPVAAVPAPGRQPHAGLLRHPVAGGSRDPHRRGELRRADRLWRVRRRPLGPRPGDRPDPQRRLHLVAGQRRAHRPGVRRGDRLEVRARRHHPRRRAAEQARSARSTTSPPCNGRRSIPPDTSSRSTSRPVARNS